MFLQVIQAVLPNSESRSRVLLQIHTQDPSGPVNWEGDASYAMTIDDGGGGAGETRKAARGGGEGESGLGLVRRARWAGPQ